MRSLPPTVEGYRRAARRALPKPLFDYIDGAAGDERTMADNGASLAALKFDPRVLVDVSAVDISTTVCGIRLDTPVLLSPTGLMGFVHPRGEVAGVTAAHAAGTAAVVSTSSTYSIEELAATGAPFWFQLYPQPDDGWTNHLVTRSLDAGCPALCVTVDSPVVGRRGRDLDNRVTFPPRATVRNAVAVARHPRWFAGWAVGRRTTFKNLEGMEDGNSFHTAPNVTWASLDRIRADWPRPLLVKGILSVEDARRAADAGVDGIVVSNHGGRQLDDSPASVRALAPIVDAVGDRVDVVLDGGVRRGGDIAKAVSLGAKACMIGRPWVYGLATAGTRGVSGVLDILSDELRTTLGLLGRTQMRDLTRADLWDGSPTWEHLLRRPTATPADLAR